MSPFKSAGMSPLKPVYQKRKKSRARLVVRPNSKTCILFRGCPIFGCGDAYRAGVIRAFVRAVNLPGGVYSITYKGGGKQAGLHCVPGLLAKYLLSTNAISKAELAEKCPGVTTTDARQKWPKKANCKGSNARRQKSYR